MTHDAAKNTEDNDDSNMPRRRFRWRRRPRPPGISGIRRKL